MEKKLLIQTIATVLLSASVLSFTPPAFGKTTSIEKSIEVIKLELKKAPTYYVHPALEGELVQASSLYPVLNSVKKNYRSIRNIILTSNLNEKKKKAYLKEIDALYNEKITKGLIPYIDAYNYATVYLEPLLKEIEAAEVVNDLASIEKAYHKLSVQLKSRTSILFRFSGKASRDLLLEKYKKTSDSKREELMVPVTIYMKVAQADKLMNEGKKEQAKKVLESVSVLIEKLPGPEKISFIDTLLKEVRRIQELVGVPLKSKTPVKPPSTSVGNTELDQTPPSSGSEKPIVNISGTLGTIANQSVTVNGQSYKVSKDLQKLFSHENEMALEAATVMLDAKNGEIVKVTKLELNKSGFGGMDPVFLNANGAIIEGSVVVNGDDYSINNLIVNGDFTISPNTKYNFFANNITVKGKTSIAQRAIEKTLFSSTLNPGEKELPSSYVYFSNSTIGTTEIAKEDVYFSAGVNTEVKSIHLLANGKISGDDYITLPQVKIENSVSKVDLSGTIQNVYVNSKNDVVITGYSNIDNLEINSNKRITLNTNGVIKNLKLNNTESTVFIVNDTVIGNLEPPNGKTAKEVVVNYYQAEDKIEKISGVFNEKFNLELKDKLNTDNFKARAWFVAGRFGYVKIDMKNQGNNIVKYTLEEKGDRVTPHRTKGEQVPVEAIEYNKGDEFIVWHDHEVVIYLVDDNGVILDLVETYELEWRSLDEVEIKQDDWVSIKTNTNVKDKLVSEIISDFYIYQNGIGHKIKNFKDYSWTFEDGIPTLNLYLEGVKTDNPSIYTLFYSRGEGRTGYLNKGYNDEDLSIYVLYEMLDEDRLNQFGSYLFLIYQGNKQPDIDPTNGVQFDSVSMDAYKQELRKNKTDLQTADAIKVMVDEVNARLKVKLDQYILARNAVYQLFREENYGYNEEQLADGITQSDIDEAFNAVEKMDNAFTEKATLKWMVGKAQRLFSKPIIDAEIVSEVTVEADVSAGSILTERLFKGVNTDDAIDFNVVAVGQKVEQKGSDYYVVRGSRFLMIDLNELILKSQNKTGTPVNEYVEVQMQRGDIHLGSKIIKVTIDSNEGITSSSNTSLVEEPLDNISTVSNDKKKVFVFEGVTTKQLLNNLKASDYSFQTYKLKNAGAEMNDEDIIEEGAVLTVTAEDGIETSEYQIEYVINLTDIQKGTLGEILFTAKNTSVEELEENIKIGGNSEGITISRVEGTTDRYKLNILYAEENRTYSFIGTSFHFHVIDRWNFTFSWETFTIENSSPFTYNNLIVKNNTIDSIDDIKVSLMEDGTNTWESAIYKDGITVTTEITDLKNGQGTIKFLATGTDLGEINNTTIYRVKIEVDGKENIFSVQLHLESNGDITAHIMS